MRLVSALSQRFTLLEDSELVDDAHHDYINILARFKVIRPREGGAPFFNLRSEQNKAAYIFLRLQE